MEVKYNKKVTLLRKYTLKKNSHNGSSTRPYFSRADYPCCAFRKKYNPFEPYPSYKQLSRYSVTRLGNNTIYT